MALIEEDDEIDDAPVIEEVDEEEEAEAERKRERKQKKKKSPSSSSGLQGNSKRDGIPLTEDLIRRKAEHNEGMLSTLEEIALHQLDIDKIEVLNGCRCLQIVYLQNNLISKIEGLHRLKQLDYLNLALNNITKIENLEGCEALRKLDLTVNFVDLDELHTVKKLKDNIELRELYLTGNPCETHWEAGCRDYVIGTLPQLAQLDGKEISKSERIKALQRLGALERELAPLAEMARDRKAERRDRRAARLREREAVGSDFESDGEGVDDWCVEVRVEDAREMREAKEKQEEARAKSKRQDQELLGSLPERARRLFKEDGTPTQALARRTHALGARTAYTRCQSGWACMACAHAPCVHAPMQINTAKWPFSIDEDALHIIVDVALPRFLDSAAVDAKVEPTYIRVKAKKHTLQLLLPAEVLTDASTAQRSTTTGHLVLTCPKVHPIVVSKAPRTKKAEPNPPGGQEHGLLPAPGDNLKGAVDVRGIVLSAPTGQAKPKPQQEEISLGPDFSDEEHVPPLCNT